jgi:signal transduction histidine kinase
MTDAGGCRPAARSVAAGALPAGGAAPGASKVGASDAATTRLRLRADPYAPRAARDALRGVPGLDDDVRSTAALLLSEIVTNSVRHAPPRGLIAVTIVADGALRVQVADEGGGLPDEFIDTGPDADGGRGLLIVSRLARAWGAQRGPGAHVWFELDLEPPASDP